MKKPGIFILLISFMACQGEKETKTTDVTTQSDTLTFSYDSVKVISKLPASKEKEIRDTSKAVISFPVFSDKGINDFVLNKVLRSADSGKNYKSYQDYAADFIKGFEDFQKTESERPQNWFLEIRNRIETQKPGYISFLSTYINYSGGAHPNSVFTYLNYNTENHQEILLDSLLIPGTEPRLNSIAEQIFRKNEKLSPTASLKDGYFFDNDIFKLNNNFTITDKGLKFLYNPYEIKAYVYGTTELIIPFKDLKGMVKPNSLLSSYK
ncbi:MAG TPA: DUF3298 domain-containing protein [Pedobacter sp.]|nr:DUF3298 domain-containing protein [Pedobacter sp.]